MDRGVISDDDDDDDENAGLVAGINAAGPTAGMSVS